MKYYLFVYNNSVVTGIYTSSKMLKDKENLHEVKDFDIKFSYLGMSKFDATVWIGKDGSPLIVYVSEQEIQRRELERDIDIKNIRDYYSHEDAW